MAKNWMAKLDTLQGAVPLDSADIHDKANIIRTKSPSLNFIFGNGWGLPLGYSVVLYGPPKAGKSVVTYEMAAGVHAQWEDGIVIKFNTEYRERGQLTREMAKAYGIDLARYKGIETNHPSEIYDQIENQIDAWCKDGMPLKLVIIDSMNGVQGRRSLDNEKGIMSQQIGDVALTNKEGLKRVLAVQRRHNFALAMTSHVAVEMDPIEQKRGNKYKMGASIGVQHHAEYFIFLDPDRTKAGRADILGREFVDESRKDLNDNAEKTAHKIRAIMKDSSMGPKGRFGYFTFDDHKGIINTWEEVYLLGLNRGIITKPNSQMYEVPGFGRAPIRGEANFVEWLQQDAQAQKWIVDELQRQDRAGLQKEYDRRDAQQPAFVPEDEDDLSVTERLAREPDLK